MGGVWPGEQNPAFSESTMSELSAELQSSRLSKAGCGGVYCTLLVALGSAVAGVCKYVEMQDSLAEAGPIGQAFFHIVPKKRKADR